MNKKSAPRVFAFAVMVLLCVCNAIVALAVPVTGRVLGPDGKPVANAEVVLTDSIGGKDSTTKTDANGRYTIEVAPRTTGDDQTQIAASAPGFAPGAFFYYQRVSTDIHLNAATTVSGLVEDENGQPVADAIVALHYVLWQSADSGDNFAGFYVPEIWKAKFTAKTGTDGRWTLSDVPRTGTATFLLEDERYVKVMAEGRLDTGKVARIVARPGAVVVGKAVFDDGKPAGGIKISAESETPIIGVGLTNATTGEDGVFRMVGLATGSYNLISQDPQKKWVSVALEDVQATEGTASQVADIVLTTGAMVEGMITDAVTGAPLAGAMVGSYGPHHPRFHGRISHETVTSDDKGHYALRVAPGKSRVFISYPPKGYLQEAHNAAVGIHVEASKGETKTADFKLRRGATVSGKVVDEALRPVAGVRLALSKQHHDEDSWSPPSTVQSDESGKWTIDGLEPGTWNITVTGPWDVAEPRAIQLPSAGEVRVWLRRLTLSTIKGRVIDTSGRPVTGATVKPSIESEKEEELITPSDFFPDLKTDEKGAFQISDVRPGSTVTLVVKKDGYIFVSGGEVTEEAGIYKSKDVVLAPLTARVEGTVVDAAKTLVAGARVLSPDGGPDALTITDENGKFVLAALPAGEVTLIAVRGNDTATMRAKTGGVVSLTLKPRVVAPGRDVWRASEILTRAKLESLGEENNFNVNDQVALMLAPYAPDVALQLGTDFYGNLSESVVASVIRRVAQADPARAALWAPDKIAGLKDHTRKLIATLNVGSAVAASDPDLGHILYQQAKKLLGERPLDAQLKDSATVHIGLWKMAVALNLPEAEEYRRAILTVTEQEQSRGNLRGIATNVADVDLELAEMVLSKIPVAEQYSAYRSLITTVARKDAIAALRLLDKSEKLPKPDEEAESGFHFGYMAQMLVTPLGKTDPAAALALARRVPRRSSWRPQALIRAARFQPKETAVSLLKEAFGVAWESSDPPPARIAALVYELDRQEGLKLFAITKSRAQQMSAVDESGDFNGLATWAFYYSGVDAAESRVILEQEFAREKENAVQLGASNTMIYLAGAMVAVDVDRALEMFAEVPVVKGDRDSFWTRTGTLQSMARYVLAPSAKRFTMSLNRSVSTRMDEDE